MRYITLGATLVLFLFYDVLPATAQTAFPAVHAIADVVEPITLTKDTSQIYLKDYFAQPREIDSVTFSKGIKYIWNKRDNIITTIAKEELKPIAEMKLWNKGFAYSIILRKAIKKGRSRTDTMDIDKPIIHTSKLGKGSFTVSVNIKRFPFSIACYWQNFKLGKGYIRHAGDEILIDIPEQAKKIKRTYIRVFANDDMDFSNDILVPLEYGEVVNDPMQLGTDSLTRLTPGVSPLPQIDSHYDAAVAFEKDSSCEVVARILQEAMARYGSHHLLSRFKLIWGEPLVFPTEGWKSKFEYYMLSAKDSSYDKMSMVIAFVYAMPGISIDTSKRFYFGGTNRQRVIQATTRTFFQLRADYLALLCGETEVSAKGNTMVIKRSYFSQKVVFVFNRDISPQSIETGINLVDLRSQFGHPATGTKVTLPPMSFEVFTK